MTVPQTPPLLLPERSANEWMRSGLKYVFSAFGMLVMIPAGALLPHPCDATTIAIVAPVGLFLCVLGFRAFMALSSAVDTERSAGYTTLYNQYYAYWQLDHRTGEVLRRPGERKANRPTPGYPPRPFHVDRAHQPYSLAPPARPAEPDGRAPKDPALPD